MLLLYLLAELEATAVVVVVRDMRDSHHRIRTTMARDRSSCLIKRVHTRRHVVKRKV